MALNWIEHRGKRILHIDAANLKNDHTQLKADLASLVTLLPAEPKSSVLVVADLRNTHLNNNALIALMSNAPLAAPYFRKSALVIESNHARRIILDSIGQFAGHLPRRFENLEQAKDWLVAEEP